MAKLLLIAQKQIPTEVRYEIEILRNGLGHDLDLHQQLPGFVRELNLSS